VSARYQFARAGGGGGRKCVERVAGLLPVVRRASHTAFPSPWRYSDSTHKLILDVPTPLRCRSRPTPHATSAKLVAPLSPRPARGDARLPRSSTYWCGVLRYSHPSCQRGHGRGSCHQARCARREVGKGVVRDVRMCRPPPASVHVPSPPACAVDVRGLSDVRLGRGTSPYEEEGERGRGAGNARGSRVHCDCGCARDCRMSAAEPAGKPACCRICATPTSSPTWPRLKTRATCTLSPSLHPAVTWPAVSRNGAVFGWLRTPSCRGLCRWAWPCCTCTAARCSIVT